MVLHKTVERQTELNGFVEAFEAAHGSHERIDLTEFLPSADHPLYWETRQELLRVDLELSWRDGRRNRIQHYVDLFPDLLQDWRALQEVAFEEYRLRILAGEAPSTTEYEQQFGVTTTGWATSKTLSLETDTPQPQASPAEMDQFLKLARTFVLDNSWHGSRQGDVAQALLRQNAQQSNSEAEFLLAQAMTALPEVGTTFLNFRLIAELGRGSFGRVYLARQGDLANRLVALKITIDLLGEEQKLAQLQHTNVVPIYSIHQARPLHAVCMPYFGSTTLVDVIREVKGQPSNQWSGKNLVRTVRSRKAEFRTTVHQLGKETGLPADGVASTTLKMLEASSYVEAIMWIAERLTEGLMHAHEHGILHRDLKPANILLTDEGQPMLLDFNLSADTKLHAGLGELQVGGTLPYMAPEHLRAMREGHRTTDARTDIYALGVVLFELLTGRLPFETPRGPLSEIVPAMIALREQAPPSLRRWNPAVSPAVESLVRHCLQPEPHRRYQTAHQLHDDLKRHRQDRPLQYAPEPSLRERTQKWVRRHPRLTSPTSLAAVVVLLLGIGIAPSAWKSWQEWQTVRTDRDNAIANAKKANAETSSANLRMAALDKFGEFQKEPASARSIMEIVNVLQVQPEAWSSEEKRLLEATARCRRSLNLYRILDDPQWHTQPAVRELPEGERDKLLQKIAELVFSLAHAEHVQVARAKDQSRQFAAVIAALALSESGREVWNASEASTEARLLAALALNENATACFASESVPRHLLMQRAELTYLAGDPVEANRHRASAVRIPLRKNSDDCYWVASTLLAQERFEVNAIGAAASGALIGQDRFSSILPLVQGATRQSPGHSGAWLLLARCQHNQGDLTTAEASYNTYLNLQMDGLWGYFNRGLLFLSKKDWSLAESDFDRVVKERPDLASAYTHRAAARKGMKKYAGAIRDLTSAIQLAPDLHELYHLRAQIHASVGNAELAKLDQARMFQNEPASSIGWTYRGLARLASDPRRALADFDQALVLNPHCPLTLYNKACLLADTLGCATEAVEVLGMTLREDPTFVDARFKRGFLLAKLGNRGRAVADAELIIQHDPTPARHYEAATIYALTSPTFREDAKRAIELLSFALRHDYGVRRYENDPHLRPLTNFLEFERLAIGLKILGAGDAPRMRP